jgi:hypothetical protein
MLTTTTWPPYILQCLCSENLSHVTDCFHIYKLFGNPITRVETCTAVEYTDTPNKFFTILNTQSRSMFIYCKYKSVITKLITLHGLTNSMEQSLWEASSHSAHHIPPPLWIVKVHYCIHKNLPLVHILRQMNLVHIYSSYFPKIYSNIYAQVFYVISST